MANILLVDDDKSMCSFLSVALKKAGHNVVEAYDGLKALALLEGASAPFDLLLTDIVMPGMDGIELSRKATQHSSHLKVMFITGFAAVAVGHEDIAPQRSALLSKPFHLSDLVEQVEALLRS